jgi:HEPN domain-containing protein
MTTREDNPDDWFLLAADRLRGADLLHAHGGVTYLGVEALHEAMERYLKGFLVARGQRIERTHNLGQLLTAAAAIDIRFRDFASLAEVLTQQFWAQHYPGGDLAGVGDDYPELRRQAGELVGLIEAAVRT